MNDTLLDQVPLLRPGIYSVYPANKVTSNAPRPNPITKRQAIKKFMFGENAATTIAIMCITSYSI